MNDTAVVSKLFKVQTSIKTIASDNDGNVLCSLGYGSICKIENNEGMNQTIPSLRTIITQANGGAHQLIADYMSNVLYIITPQQLQSFFMNHWDTSVINHHLDNLQVVVGTSLMYHPPGMVLDQNGDLYFTHQHMVKKFIKSQGTLEIIAGSSTSGWSNRGHRDGECSKTLFDGPSGIAITPYGTIYIADTNNHCIRKIQNGVVSTIAGSPGRQGYQDGTLQKSLLSYPISLLYFDRKLVIIDSSEYLRVVNFAEKSLRSSYMPYGYRPQCFSPFIRGPDMLLISSGTVYKVESTWKWERVLWIGRQKEEGSYCHLAGLPKDIVREIIICMRVVLAGLK